MADDPRPWRRSYVTGSGFQEAFRRGAQDALRLVGREIDDPDVWAVLDRIAENYACAGLVTYDGRTAARTTEQPSDLQPIDVALTFTGIAAEIRDRFGPPT
jgi:hypothetical protein